MSENSPSRSDQEVNVSDTAGIVVKDEVAVIANDEPENTTPISDEKDESHSTEKEDISKQNENNENNENLENENNDDKQENNDNDKQDNDDKQPTNSTFLTETAEIHLLKATDSGENHKSSKKIEQPQPIDQAEIESALNSLLEKNKLPPPEYTDQLIQLINHKRMDCLENSDYKGAENLDSALFTLVTKNSEESQQKSIQNNETMFNDRLDSIKSRITDINNRYDLKMQTVQNNFEEKYQQLSEIHESQISQFKEKWQNPDFLKQFDRPSKNLLSMRNFEKQMALSGRYKDAKGAKIQADRIQQQEEKEAQKQMEEIMKAEFLKLRNQQQLEVNKMSSRNDAQLEEIEMQREKELEPWNVALKKLNNKKKSILSQNLRQKSVSVKISIPKVHQNSPSTSQKTPRTAQRVIKYKNTCQTDFSILPIDDQQFSRLVSISSKQKARSKSSVVKKSLPPL